MAEDDVVPFESGVFAGFAIEDARHLHHPSEKRPHQPGLNKEHTVIALQDDIPQTLKISPEATDLDTSHFLAYCPMIDSISSSILSSFRFSCLVFLIIARSSLSLAFQYLIKSLSLVIHSSLVLPQKPYTKKSAGLNQTPFLKDPHTCNLSTSPFSSTISNAFSSLISCTPPSS